LTELDGRDEIESLGGEDLFDISLDDSYSRETSAQGADEVSVHLDGGHPVATRREKGDDHALAGAEVKRGETDARWQTLTNEAIQLTKDDIPRVARVLPPLCVIGQEIARDRAQQRASAAANDSTTLEISASVSPGYTGRQM